jgi:uncharacterized protein YdeI (YjbR/CyaY-like superfamily)
LKPKFFKTPDEFRAWLEKNHDKTPELWVGFYKKAANRKGMTWEEAVDVGLCFGWIDSIFRPIDEMRRIQRFTPRKAKSNWSQRNIDRVAELTRDGLMHPAGRAAFERRERSPYSYEAPPGKLSAAYEKKLRANKKGWSFFESQAPSYRRIVAHWIGTAKKEETRDRRFAQLLESCKRGERLKQFVSPPPKR